MHGDTAAALCALCAPFAAVALEDCLESSRAAAVEPTAGRHTRWLWLLGHPLVWEHQTVYELEQVQLLPAQ